MRSARLCWTGVGNFNGERQRPHRIAEESQMLEDVFDALLLKHRHFTNNRLPPSDRTSGNPGHDPRTSGERSRPKPQISLPEL